MSAIPAPASVRARVRAQVVDQALAFAIAAAVFTMAVQTGVAAVAAVVLAAPVRAIASLFGADADRLMIAVVAALVLGLVELALGVIGEGSPSGQTPGKRVAHVRVVGPDGAAPGYARAAVRQAAKALALLSVAGVVAWARGRAWHDRWTGTAVVGAPAPPSG